MLDEWIDWDKIGWERPIEDWIKEDPKGDLVGALPVRRFSL